jgi:hypothetical protein
MFFSFSDFEIAKKIGCKKIGIKNKNILQLLIIYSKGKIFCTYRADWIEEHGQYLLHEQHHPVLVQHQQLRYPRSSRETVVRNKRLLGNSVFIYVNP